MPSRSSPSPSPGGGFGQPFTPYAVAKGNQRTSGSGLLGAQGTARASQTIQTSIGPKQTVQYPATGRSFYLRATSAPLNIRPSNGPFDSYTAGKGLNVDAENLFSLVEVQNTSAFPVAFSLWVGFGDFIDKTLILETGIVFPVWKVTYSPTPPVAGPIAIPDISGQAFSDLNGGQWFALSRLAFYVDNLSNSNLVIQDAASDGNVAGIVFPFQTRTFATSGSFSLKNGAATLNAGVQELYSAIVNTT